MTEQEKAKRLADWLAQPAGTPPPKDLDPEVVAAVWALRPDRAPAPRVSLDEILAGVRTGPYAAGAEAGEGDAGERAPGFDEDADDSPTVVARPGDVHGGEVIAFPGRREGDRTAERAAAAPTGAGAPVGPIPSLPPTRKPSRATRWLPTVALGLAAAAAVLLILPVAGNLKTADMAQREAQRMAEPAGAPASAPAAPTIPEATVSEEATPAAAPRAEADTKPAAKGAAPADAPVFDDGEGVQGGATGLGATAAPTGGAPSGLGGLGTTGRGGGASAGGYGTGGYGADATSEAARLDDAGGDAGDDDKATDEVAQERPRSSRAAPSPAEPAPVATPVPLAAPTAAAPAPPPAEKAEAPREQQAAGETVIAEAEESLAPRRREAKKEVAAPEPRKPKASAPSSRSAPAQTAAPAPLAAQAPAEEAADLDTLEDAPAASAATGTSTLDAGKATSAKDLARSATPLDYDAGWYRRYVDVAAVYDAARLQESQGGWAAAAATYGGLVGDARTVVAQDAAWRQAKALRAAGRPSEALAAVDAGLRRSGANTVQRANLLALRGDLLAAQGRAAEAEAAWAEAARLNAGR